MGREGGAGAETSIEGLQEALAEMRAALGDAHVSTDLETRREFGDHYAPASWDQYVPPAVVQPSSVEEVQAVVRTANAHGVSLWPNGQGRNNGYGGAAARTPDAIVVNLRRMNRVLEVNDEFAYVVVEPGVSFEELYAQVQAGGHKVWIDVPDLGWGSVVGNALEHGVGYTANGDRAASVCGMEVVLPDGELLRTGMGAMSSNKTWHLAKRGFGPSADGIFMQSNFGVVTKMGLWCMRQPETYLSGWVTLEDDAHLPDLLEAVRPLMIDRTIMNYPTVFTAFGALSVVRQRSEIYDGPGSVPFEVAKEIVAPIPGLGIWNMRFALYGRESTVDSQFAHVADAIGAVPGAEVSGKKFRGDSLDPSVLDQSSKVQAGIPDLELLNTLDWIGAERAGHIGFATTVPLRGEDGRRIVDLVRKRTEEVGFDYIGGLLLNQRSMIHVTLMIYDAEDVPMVERAYGLCEELVVETAKLGYGEYRSHLANMDLVAEQFDFNDHAMRRFNERLKDAIDPNGILAPGKQGIWPSRLREQASFDAARSARSTTSPAPQRGGARADLGHPGAAQSDPPRAAPKRGPRWAP